MPCGFTVAIPAWLDCQVIDELKVCWLPSLMVAIACNLLLLPSGNDNVPGTTLSATTAAGVTAMVIVPVSVPMLALIVPDPADFATADPIAFTLTAGPEVV